MPVHMSRLRCKERGEWWDNYVFECLVVADIIKYFGCDLGAQTKYDKASGTSIVNGAHDTARLCELLESFIKK